MAGAPTDGAPAPTPSGSTSIRRLFSTRNLAIGAAAFGALIVVMIVLHYHSGSQRRQYETLLTTTLDKIVTAEEGFYYDSTRYVASVRALPTIQLPAGVRVTLFSPDRRSWWGIATHDKLPAHRCIVWVGKPPASLPLEATSLKTPSR